MHTFFSGVSGAVDITSGHGARSSQVRSKRLAVSISALACWLAMTSAGVAQSIVATPESFRTPEFNASWGLGKIGAEYAYSMGFTGAGIKLGIADGAFQFTHPEFDGRVYYPAVFPLFPLPDVPEPDHGTHVMGLAAAARNNTGMMGVAFDARLAGVVAVNDEEGYPAADDWAGELIEAGVSVMNGSFGPDALPPKFLDDERTQPNPTYRIISFQLLNADILASELNDIKRLSEEDVVMVFAAGNDHLDQPISTGIPLGAGMIPLITPELTRSLQPNCDVDFEGLYCFVVDNEPVGSENDPTTWEYASVNDVDTFDGSPYIGTVIAVVATDENNNIAGFSNRCGAAADWCIAAPGVNLLSSVPMSTYDEDTGTSMASPLVAGGAALVRQAFPYMTARQAIEVLLTTATDMGDPSVYGHGLLNLQRAVRGPVEFGHPSLIEGNPSIFAPIFAIDTQGYNSVWSNDIVGTGGFSKAGEGVLTLTGNNTYTGTTTITGGTLRVDGSIAASSLTIGPQATLQGTGTVGNTQIAGVLSPGNSVGTLTVDGDLAFADGSVYLFEVDEEQRADSIVVSGDTVIDPGAMFKLESADGALLDTPYVIIDSNSIQGSFEIEQAQLTFVGLGFSVIDNDLYLDIERNDTSMASFAQTNNQRAVATAIDQQSPGDEPFNEVVLNDDPSQLPNMYQDWSGEIYSANQAALLYDSRLLAQVVNWRLQDGWHDGTVTRLQQVGQANADTTMWAQAYGNWDSFSANADAQKATANSGGLLIGLDHQVTPALRLGGGFAASVTTTTVAASQAQTSGYHVLLYGAYERDALRLSGGLVQSWYSANVNRTLPFDDQGNARGTVASNSTQLFADLSTPIVLHEKGLASAQGPSQRTTLWPFAQVSQTWLRTANFGETGAEAALSGQSANASVGFGTVGARLQHQWQTDQTVWQATLSAGWQRAWGDLSPTTSLAFATGPDFTVSAAPIARDSAVIEVGLGASLGPSSRFNLVYSATLAGQSSSQMLQAQLLWRF